jgi:hypothetical protein
MKISSNENSPLKDQNSVNSDEEVKNEELGDDQLKR